MAGYFGGCAAGPSAAGSPRTLRLGTRAWDHGSFGIMAVVNRTPDSFFDRGTTVAEVAARHRIGLVCSHAGGLLPRTRPHRPAYRDVVREVTAYVTDYAERAVVSGVSPSAILVDPAHDFGKNTWQSLEITRRLDELTGTGWPVLVAVADKDFIGETLSISGALPVDQRAEGTIAALAVCAWLGARVFRVHNVPAARAALTAVASLSYSARTRRT